MMTEARWGSLNRFQGLNVAHAEFARTVALAGRCWPGSFGDRVSSGIEPRKSVNTGSLFAVPSEGSDEQFVSRV